MGPSHPFSIARSSSNSAYLATVLKVTSPDAHSRPLTTISLGAIPWEQFHSLCEEHSLRAYYQCNSEDLHLILVALAGKLGLSYNKFDVAGTTIPLLLSSFHKLEELFLAGLGYVGEWKITS